MKKRVLRMKFGVRKPSVKKSIKARTTGKAKRAVKRSIDPTYGKKGSGWVKNPKKAAYNKVYNKTTKSVTDFNYSGNKKGKRSNSGGPYSNSGNGERNSGCGCGFLFLAMLIIPIAAPFFPIFAIFAAFAVAIVCFINYFRNRRANRYMEQEEYMDEYYGEPEEEDTWDDF